MTTRGYCMAAALAALLLSSCAYIPISEQPVAQADIERCTALSEQHSIVPGGLFGGAVGAGIGSFATGAINGITMDGTAKLGSLSLPTHSAFAIANLTVPFAIAGIAWGVLRALERRDDIVRACLRDLGHKVY